MSDAPSTEDGNSSPSLGDQVEQVCDRAEAAWKAGRRPRIEDDLGAVPEPGRGALLRALLALELDYRRRNGERPTPEEYHRRFPEHAAVIDTVFGAASPPRAARPGARADHHLLFGLLALQNGFIDRDTLLTAFNAWVANKSQDLGQLLLERGAVDAGTHTLLEALARKHLAMHGDDPERSLAALSSLGSARATLEQVADPELQASLTHVATDPAANQGRGEATGIWNYAAGASSSAGNGTRFRILRPHARGGLGEIYVARDEELKREVALKEIQGRYADDAQSRARFVVEAEVTGRLEHPGIVPVYGLGTYGDGRPFYAMRFIKGDSLKEAIAQFHQADARGRDPGQRQLVLQKLLRRFLDVCNAVAYAHSRGVLHRDLKPGNVMLGPYGETLVVDWGLAKAVGRAEGSAPSEEKTLRPEASGGSSDTLPGDQLGTPEYMSPEQAAGRVEQLGVASDVYSLGATLYCLLTGKAPFEGRDPTAILQKVQRGDFPPPRQVDRAIDPALEAICLKAMALQPAERYATPRLLAEDLDRWLAGEPVSAWREPWTVRARRWRARHHPLVAAVAAALAVALVAGTFQLAAAWTRGSSLAQAILAAEIGKVPTLVEELEGYRPWADPVLAAHLKAEPGDSSERLRAALALVPVDARQADYLFQRLLKATPEELLVIRDALKPSGPALRPRLWAVFGDPKAGPDARLRAAAALAAFDPDDPRWQAQNTAIVNGLVKEDPQVLRFWTEAFRPARSNLISQLAATFQNQSRSEAERTLANNLLLAYADRPEDLAVLVQSAGPPLFDALITRIAKSPAQAVSHLQRALAQTLEPRWNDPPLDPAWATPDPALATRIDQAQGLLAERFAFCQSMPLEVFAEVAEGLRRSGYRPTRFRPYRAAATVRVAAVRTRDGRPWQIVHGALAESLRQKDADWQRLGYRLIDLAGYLAAVGGQGSDLVYAAVWAKSLGPDDRAQFDLDLTQPQWKNVVSTARGKQGFVLDTRSIALATDGKLRSCAVWVRGDPGLKRREVRVGNRYVYEAMQVGSKLQVDVGLSLEAPEDQKQMNTATLALAEQALKTKPNDPSVIEARSRVRFYLDQFEETVADLTKLMSLKKSSDQTFLRRSRCYAHLGKPDEAKTDFAEYLNRSNKSVRDDPEAAWADAVIACQLGQDTEGLKRLEETLTAHPGNTEFLFYAAWAYAEASRTITTKGNGDRAVQLLQEAVANGFNTNNDFARIRDTPDLEPIRSHPGYRALTFPAGLDRQFAGIWSESKTLESQESHGLVPAANLERCREWAAQGYRPAAVAVAAPGDDLPLVTASVWHRPLTPPEVQRDRVRQQGQAAAALVQLGRPELVWPLLSLSPDPSLRTEVIHSLARFDSGSRAVKAVIERLETEPDASARRALILTLGEFPATAITAQRQPLIARLLGWYRNDPDPGVHSAVDWLLRQKWGQAGELDRLDREFSGMGLPTDRNWYVNTEGQTLAIIRDPGSFLMGSPPNEAGHTYYETQHLVRIGRSFAIATKEVTDAQYKRSRYSDQGTDLLRNTIPRLVDWYSAARYCNWLSQQDQIPEDQWCYPQTIEAGMTLASDYLERTGYRLPTEAEWEYACRAGTTTSRPHGSGDLWLGQYVWCYETSNGKYSGRPVGQLKPNDLGLFDILGNVYEWVQDPFDLFILEPNGRARTDSGIARIVTATSYRTARGGHGGSPMTYDRSAYRYPVAGTDGSVGFRPARTYHPQNLDTVIARYRELIHHKPDDVSAHVNLGLVLRTGGRLDAAIVEYREAIRLNPDRDASYESLAGALWDTGNVGEMVAVLQQAVERKPDSGGLRHRLALSLLLAGDREGYRRACAATVERFGRATHGSNVAAARGCLLVPDALDDPSAPLRMLEAATNPQPYAYAFVLGLAHYRAGQHEQAIRDLNTSIETHPHWPAHALTRLVLAMAHHRLGHAEEARRWLENAHDPRGGEAFGLKPGEVLSATRPWWENRGDYQILRREADELILGAVLPAKPPAP